MAEGEGKTDEPVKEGVVVQELDVKREVIIWVISGVIGGLVGIGVQEILIRRLPK